MLKNNVEKNKIITYDLNLENVFGVCECGCVIVKNENDVYKPQQINNYKEVLQNFNKNFWCCNGCQNGFYKDGEEHSYLDKNLKENELC